MEATLAVSDNIFVRSRGVYSVYRGLSRLSTFDEGSLRNRWRLWLFLICCVHLAALASGASYFVVSYRAFEASTPGGRLSVTDYLACGTFAVGYVNYIFVVFSFFVFSLLPGSSSARWAPSLPA